MPELHIVIKKPLLSEKASALKAEANKVVFKVDISASKPEIRRAVQTYFDVTVLDVSTMRYPGKHKRVGRNSGTRSPWKKAIVTLKEGDEIDVLGKA